MTQLQTMNSIQIITKIQNIFIWHVFSGTI